jgi:hypothetical protein
MLKIAKSPVLAGLFFILLLGCQNPKTPDQVTLLFWQALAANDLETAKQFVTVESANTLKPATKYQGATFSVGQIVIDQEQARVETIALKTDKTQSVFTTYLIKQQQSWLVDYQRSEYSLTDNLFNGLFNSLKNIGENLNKQLEEQVPKLEKEMESFGQELKKQLDELGDELEKTLPPPKPTNPYQDSI